MSTITESATKTDGDLVRIDSEAAREELAKRVEWRRRQGLPANGLLRPGGLQFAPEKTVEALADLDVPVAVAERLRRGGPR